MNFKSKGIAYILWLVSIFGWLGFHRFYLGKVGTGILWIFTGGLFGFGSLFDLFTLGGKVEQYNTKTELETIRVATLNNISSQNTNIKESQSTSLDTSQNSEKNIQLNFSSAETTISTDLSAYDIVQGILLFMLVFCFFYAIFDLF